VVQRTPTSRASLLGLLSGSIKLLAEAKSYIHIWSGRPSMRLGLPSVRGGREELVRAIEQKARELARGAVSEPAGLLSYGDRLAIPGSSLKGAVRSRLELLFTPRPDGAIASCFAVQKPLAAPPSKGQHGWRHYLLWAPATEEARPMACGRGEQACVICDIFGAPGLASRIFFGNLWLSGSREEWTEELPLDYGERVMAFKPGAKFVGSLDFLGLRPEELGLLVVGMRLHEDRPILIGKNKYRIRKRADTGREIVFGRLSLEADAISFAPWCAEEAREIAEEARARLGERDGELVAQGDGLRALLAHLASLARQAFPDLRHDFDEVVRLEEEIWRGET